MRRCAHPESTVIEAWCAVLAVVSVGAAVRPQPVLVTQVRNLNAVATGGLQNRLARQRFDLTSVQDKGNGWAFEFGHGSH